MFVERNPLSASGLEELLFVMEEALEDLKRHLEDSPDSSAVSSSRVLSRQRRSNLYPFYIVRNIVTLIQVSLVLARKFIVVGQYFYNRFNVGPEI